MEWYFGSDIEDLAVPKDEVIFDRLPSPDSWSSWGKIVGNFNSPKKLTVLGVEEFLLSETMFSSEVEQRSAPSVCQGYRHAFCQQSAYPREHSDVELNDLSIIDEADDIFFRSLFKADPSAIEGAESSAKFTQTSSKDDVMSAVDLLGERNHIHDCTNNVEKVCHFPPAKEPEFEICVSEEHSDVCEDISEEDIPTEESVLLELQRLTVQLAKKTRICFRDSFYRLAENSRHQTKCSKNGKEDQENCKPTTSGGPSRLRESKAKKLDTKAIDRTVATLLFHTMKCCNLAAASTSDLTAETPQREYQANSRMYQPSSSISSLCTVPGGDAEVPTFGLNNQPLQPPKCHSHFSTASVMWS
ncbi:hypothetical protein Pfo_001862 [Paulownia fortunei]|nr:hypothetical protein Pfo_001862 [Paulownia fortunei]